MFVCPGYKEYDDYPFQCEYTVDSIAAAIIKAWENRDLIDARKWAEERHNVVETVKQSMDVYRRYL